MRGGVISAVVDSRSAEVRPRGGCRLQGGTDTGRMSQKCEEKAQYTRRQCAQQKEVHTRDRERMVMSKVVELTFFDRRPVFRTTFLTGSAIVVFTACRAFHSASASIRAASASSCKRTPGWAQRAAV